MKIPKQGSRWGAFRVLKHDIEYKDYVSPDWKNGGGGCEKNVKHTYVTVQCSCGEEMPPVCFEPWNINDVPGDINYMTMWLDCGCGAGTRAPNGGLTPTGRLRRIDTGIKKAKEVRVMMTITVPVSVRTVLDDWANTYNRSMSDYINSAIVEKMKADGLIEENRNNA